MRYLLLCFLFLSSATYSQNVSIQGGAALSLGDLSQSSQTFSGFAKNGFNVSCNARFHLAKNWHLSASGNYSSLARDNNKLARALRPFGPYTRLGVSGKKYTLTSVTIGPSYQLLSGQFGLYGYVKGGLLYLRDQGYNAVWENRRNWDFLKVNADPSENFAPTVIPGIKGYYALSKDLNLTLMAEVQYAKTNYTYDIDWKRNYFFADIYPSGSVNGPGFILLFTPKLGISYDL